MRDFLVILLFAGLGGMLAYQVYMFFWARKATGKVPKTVTVLRIVNMLALAAAIVLVAFALGRG